MMRRFLAGLALFVLVGTADAAIFSTTIGGSGGILPNVPPSFPQTGVLDWMGTLTFETSSMEDGLYRPCSLYGCTNNHDLHVTLDSNLTKGLTVGQYGITILGGQVVDYYVAVGSWAAMQSPLYGSGQLFVQSDKSDTNFADGLNGFATVEIGPSIGYLSSQITVAPVPEPATYALMLAGLGAVAFAAKRRAKR